MRHKHKGLMFSPNLTRCYLLPSRITHHGSAYSEFVIRLDTHYTVMVVYSGTTFNRISPGIYVKYDHE